MKKLSSIVVTGIFVLLTDCTGTPVFQTGPDAEVSPDGLTRIDHSSFDAAWARTDIDLSGVDSVMLEEVEIQYRPVSGQTDSRLSVSRGDLDFPLTDAQKERLRETVAAAFTRAMQGSGVFDLVNVPGPGVLLIRATLVDVVSNVPPETVSRTDVYLSSVGEATLIVEIFDSASGAILARIVDRDAAEDPTTFIEVSPVTTWAEVQRLADRWATALRRRLEEMITTGPV